MPGRNGGPKLLGLLTLAVGIVAMGAGVAQAEESGGKWTYRTGGTKELREVPNEETYGIVEEETNLTLLTKILKKEVEFVCTAVKSENGKLFTGGVALGLLMFTGCETKVGKVKQPACEPIAEGKKPGVIKTLAFVGTLLLHKLANGTKDKIFVAEPDTSSNAFAHIEMSLECAIGLDVLVNGKFALVDCKDEGEQYFSEHLITEFKPLTHLWVISDTEEHAAHIDGSAIAFLAGVNGGLEWAASWK